MPCTRSVHLTSSKDFDPLVDLHLLEVLLWVDFALFFYLCRSKKLTAIGRITLHRSLCWAYLIDLITLLSVVALGCLVRSDWHWLRLAPILHQVRAIGWLLDPCAVQIVSLHAVEATEDEEPLIVENHRLVESSRRGRDVEGDPPSPGLRFKVVLMDVVEALQSQIDASKHIHSLLRCARCVPVAAFYRARDVLRLQPDVKV